MVANWAILWVAAAIVSPRWEWTAARAAALAESGFFLRCFGILKMFGRRDSTLLGVCRVV